MLEKYKNNRERNYEIFCMCVLVCVCGCVCVCFRGSLSVGVFERVSVVIT